ncbi:RecX family transcriptional regulator [candidate division NPL-UPA2 bacterium]|nr:RecX family transcriptional regulator [candidate division NPL-UPA2 bacterium]
MSKITAIERQRRRPGRRSLFIDGSFLCGVDEEIVLKLNLEVGQEVNQAQIRRIIFKEEARKAKDYALNLLSFRPRSTREVRDRLKRKDYDEKVIEEAVENLKRIGLINDEEFARSWAQSRMQSKPMGRRLLEQELRQKGIDKEIIEVASEATYGQHDEETLALTLAKKKLKSYRGLDDLTIKRRLYGYLGRRGFSPETISEVLEKIR